MSTHLSLLQYWRDLGRVEFDDCCCTFQALVCLFVFDEPDLVFTPRIAGSLI